MKNLLYLLFVMPLLFSCGGSSEDELSLCKCKENYWDPQHKKYGELNTLEDTGVYGGKVMTKRKNMMNPYNNMVAFDKMSKEDQEIRKKCQDKYASKTKVMRAECD